MTLVWSKIPLESGPSRRQLQARQPPCRTAMSDTHHIGSARNLWPDASSETGHRCQTAPGSKRQCFINRRRRSRTPGQLLPGGCLARSRPRREPVSSRWPAPASAPRRDERLAGRGPGTTWVRAPCGPRLSDDVQDERLAGARGRGTVPGTSAWRAAAVCPGGTRYGCTAQARCPRSFSSAARAQCQGSSGSPGVGLCVTIRVAEQLTTLDPLCQVKSPCPRHLPDRGRAGRVTPPAG